MAEVVTVESSSDEGEENSNNLTREECEERCQSFAQITDTDTALAMFYLQDRDWNLETSLNDYFQSLGEGNQGNQATSQSSIKLTLTASKSSTSSSTVASSNSKTDQVANKKLPGPSAAYLTTAPPVLQPRKEGQIRILSWNIDGIDPDNFQSRTQGVCSVLKQENPDVIFLQEVVLRSLAVIESSLTDYHYYTSYDSPALLPTGAYFAVMLVRKECVITDNVRLTDFPTTKMARNLLEVQCRIKSIPVTLMTSHLESTAESKDERQRQLRIAFDEMKRCSADTTTIFGGDLNLREKELSGISAKPPGIYDMWECTGKRPEAKFTWDLAKNDNKQFNGKFQPRCRFDRLYIAHPKDTKVRLKPVYFELVGIQRLSSCRRFPSDHWGILSHLSIVE